jgi:hypothetical protein
VGEIILTYHYKRHQEQRSTNSTKDDEHVHLVGSLVLLLGRLFFGREGYYWCCCLALSSLNRSAICSGQGLRRLAREDGLDEALDLATGNADVHEVGVGGLVLCVNLAGVLAENLADKLQVLCALPHERAGVALCDLDVALKHLVVLEAELKGSDGHGLWDGDEVEDGLFLDTSHVEEAVFGALEGEEDHLALTLKSLLLVLGQEDFGQGVDVLAPDLAGPEVALVFVVLPDVANDVGLLQELTHALHQLGPLEQHRVRQASLDEQTGKTLTDKTSDVVAVQLVVFDRVHTLLEMLGVLGVISHAVAHPLGDVPNDDLVSLLDLAKLPADNVKLDQKLAILLFGTVLGEGPSRVVEDLVMVMSSSIVSRPLRIK